MSIEPLRPHKNLGLFERISSFIERHRGVPQESDPEFFNKDKSRKWVFYNWNWGDNEESVQLDVALRIRIGQSWITLMKGSLRKEPGTEAIYGIEIPGIQDGYVYPSYYDNEAGGRKRQSGWKESVDIEGFTREEVISLLHNAGVHDDSELPTFIDFEKTLRLFMNQAKVLDFSTPQIIEKKLLD